MVTKEQIIQDLKKTSLYLDKVPSLSEYEKFGTHSARPILRIFGSWQKAINELFGISRKTPQQRKQIECLSCKNKTFNRKFCSQSCSTSFFNQNVNGRKTGKQRKLVACKHCGDIVQTLRRLYCNKCSKDNKIKTSKGTILYTSAIKSDLLTKDTQKYRRIRQYARIAAKKHGLLDKCFICDYSLHVECAHKKAINSFSDDTLISVINDRLNLVGLCPNHHWEFENGLIDLG